MSRLTDSVDYSFKCTLKRMTVVPLVALFVFTAFLVSMIGFLLWTMFWVNHANRVISKGLSVEKVLLDVQTGVRGYFLTGDDAFLDPYNASRPAAPQALLDMEEMVKDNAGQRAVASKINTDATAWLTFVDQSLKTNIQSKVKPTTASIREGKRLFDLIRAACGAFLETETALRDARTANAMHVAEGAIALTLAALIALGIWQARFTRHGLRMTTDRYRQAVDLAERRNEHVKQVVRELDNELRAVAEIQRSLLPLELPQIPLLRLAASYQTSKRAGGDYYDFFRLPADDSVSPDQAKWGVLIADVSGHGTPAAVLMAVTHAIAHGIERPLDAPSRLLGFVNDRLCDGYTSGNAAFVTAFFGIYDPVTRTLEYSSAGHNPPRFLRRNESIFHALDDAQGLPLGVEAGEAYPDKLIRMDVGDTLVLYTDGWIEARDANNELFTVERLESLFNSVAHLSPTAMIEHAIATLHDYVGDRPPQDDCTLLVLQMTDRVTDDAPTHAIVSADTGMLAEMESVLSSEPSSLATVGQG